MNRSENIKSNSDGFPVEIDPSWVIAVEIKNHETGEVGYMGDEEDDAVTLSINLTSEFGYSLYEDDILMCVVGEEVFDKQQFTITRIK